MGGGIRGNRPSYSQAYKQVNSKQPTLDNYKDDNTEVDRKKRVFISFHIDDEAQVNLLRHQAKDEDTDLEFIDYSVKEPFDEKWKTQATERIKRSSVVIVMVGAETHERDAANWEIKKAYELNKKVICVRIYKNEKHKIPQECREKNAKVIKWDLKAINNELSER